MLLFVLMIWLFIGGLKAGFRILSFAGRIALGMIGAVVMLSLVGAAGAALIFLILPVLALVFLI